MSLTTIRQYRDNKGRFIKQPRWVEDIKFTETRKVKQDLLMLKLITWSIVTIVLTYFAGRLGATGSLF